MAKVSSNKELNPAIAEKIQKASKQFSGYLHNLANEPTVGLYHVQEHIRRTIPKNIELKRELKKKYQAVEATNYDLDFSLQTVKGLHDLTTFKDIKDLFDRANEILNQLQRGPVPPSPAKTTTETKPPPQILQTPTKPPPAAAAAPPSTPQNPTNTAGFNTLHRNFQPPPGLTDDAAAAVNPTEVPLPLSPPPTPAHTQQPPNEPEQPQATGTTEIIDSPRSVSRSVSYEDVGSGSGSASTATEGESSGAEAFTTPEKRDNLGSPERTETTPALSPSVEVTPRKTTKKAGAKKKPKAAKSLAASFDLQPKQF